MPALAMISDASALSGRVRARSDRPRRDTTARMRPGAARLVLALALAAALPTGAAALDLAGALDSAQRYDTQVNSARQQLAAVRERLPQARANQLPSLAAGASGTVGAVDTDLAARKSFNNLTGSLSFAFPLYRPANAVLVDQASLGIQQAESQLALALQDLVTRVGIAYFDVLAAQDSVEVAQAQRRAISEQFEAAKRNFEVGTATVTDQQEAQARLDLNAAQLAVSRNDLAVRRAALAQITGVPSDGLDTLRLEATLPTLEPAELATWVSRARENAYAVRLQTLAVEIARRDIDRARYAKSPAVDLVSSAALVNGKTANGAYSAVDRTSTLSAGIQLTVPLYSGGGLDARERETVAALSRAESDLETARRNAEQLTRQTYLGLVSSTEQVRALEAAVRSSRLALDSNLLGYQVGVRVNVDVLNAQQQLFQAYRDLSRARYDVLLNGLRLRAAAGQLNADDILALNKLLSAPGAGNFPALAPATPPAGNSGASSTTTGDRAVGSTSSRPRQSAPRVTKPIAPADPATNARRSMPR